jgi:hypothetical protein
LLFPVFSGFLAGLRPPQNYTGMVDDPLLTADFINRH